MKEKQNQRNLNKKILPNIDDVEMESADGKRERERERERELTLHIISPYTAEQIEMGGIVDPERGALIYRKTTQVETVEPEDGSEFTVKKIKKVTSESTWIGQPEKVAPPEQDEVKPWHDEEVDNNPLYSSATYASDFHNPLYTNQQSAVEGPWTLSSQGGPEETGDTIQLVPTNKKGGRASRGRPGSEVQEYEQYLSAQPGIDTADVLF